MFGVEECIVARKTLIIYTFKLSQAIQFNWSGIFIYFLIKSIEFAVDGIKSISNFVQWQNAMHFVDFMCVRSNIDRNLIICFAFGAITNFIHLNLFDGKLSNIFGSNSPDYDMVRFDNSGGERESFALHFGWEVL